jgi:hypothetical protein
MILLLLAVQAPAPLSDDPRFWDDPPTAMIDFLGRRRLCAELPEPADRDAGYRQEAARLQCAGLPTEERGWRTRYAGQPDVLRWIDRDPLGFHLNSIVISAWHGPPGAHVRRVEQRGIDAQTGRPYHLVVDGQTDSNSVRITASYLDRPERSFTLDARRVPWLDLQSLEVSVGTPPLEGRLHLAMRYGEPRGYCGIGETDDRPQVVVSFERERIIAQRSERTNCQADWTDLTDAAAR